MENRIAIIGLGPGGIAAGIQLHRYGLRPRIYEPSESPGLLKNANNVENYPGFPEGITGPDLYARFREQLEEHSPEIIKEHVSKVTRDGEQFIVDTGQSAGRFNYVIVATGTRPLELDIPHPKDRTFYDVTDVTEGYKNVIVLGGGDAAFDYALNLNGQGKEVTVVCRGDRPKCLELLEERCRVAEIKVIPKANLTAVEGKGPITVTLDDSQQLEADCLLCALGRGPVLEMLDKDLRETLDNVGKVEGLYLVGDVKNGLKRQVGIAVGDGLRAAMDIWEMMR
jgi:thioredoxin reductase (NADPH)